MALQDLDQAHPRLPDKLQWAPYLLLKPIRTHGHLLAQVWLDNRPSQHLKPSLDLPLLRYENEKPNLLPRQNPWHRNIELDL
jgi:hypothetical protein